MDAFIGSGKIKIAPFDSASVFGKRAFVDVGNSSTFQFSFSEDKKTLRDNRDPSGGTDASFARLDSISGQMDLRHFTAANLAMALWGTTTVLAATAITGEAHKAHFGKFVPMDRLINTTVALVVKKDTTTIAAADYTVSIGGLTFADTLSTEGVTDADDITVDYTPLAGSDIQALINSAPNVSIFFEGTNAVDGKAASVRMYKCKLGVASNIGFIGDDFGTLTITFTIEKDETVPGTGRSKYFSHQQAS